MKNISFKSVISLLLPLAIFSCMGCSTINKAYWDHQVDELCEKDGGVTIYERVEISKSDYPEMRFAPNGEPFIPNENHMTDKDPFYSTFHAEYLKRGSPEIMRYESKIIRKNDNKTLRESISYGRRGGDSIFLIWAHPSSYSCGLKNIDEEEKKVIFFKED